MFLTIKRTLKEAWNNFLRNSWLSLAAISISVMSLYVIGILYVVTFTANNILKNVQDKVNVSVYLNINVPEEKILEMKGKLEGYGEIKSVEYVSRDKALENFKAINADEPRILKSLEEIGENPLPASLVIKTWNSNSYGSAVEKINNDSDLKENVDWINYERDKNKDIVEKLNRIVATIRRAGVVVGTIFAAVAILIIFNTLRIAIYTQRQEIEIMRLVGASNAYIRLPFVFEGILYGIIASLISMLFLLATLKLMSPHLSSVIPKENLISFYASNFWIIFGIEIITGIVIGTSSSLIAIRKYLKV